jgi:hypothetical protein
MSEEERKEENQEVNIPTRLSKFLGITSFVLALLSFAIMLFFWIVVLIEVSDRLFGVSSIIYLVSSILGVIVFFLFPPCVLLAFLAPILGCCAYLRIDTQMNPLLKRCAIWSVILSLFYWVLFYIQHTVYIPGYGW